ncbi:MAG TPA: hypothetical protein VGG75_10905 [Trebonia sp.]
MTTVHKLPKLTVRIPWLARSVGVVFCAESLRASFRLVEVFDEAVERGAGQVLAALKMLLGPALRVMPSPQVLTALGCCRLHQFERRRVGMARDADDDVFAVETVPMVQVSGLCLLALREDLQLEPVSRRRDR